MYIAFVSAGRNKFVCVRVFFLMHKVDGMTVQAVASQFLLDKTEIDWDECICCKDPSAV